MRELFKKGDYIVANPKDFYSGLGLNELFGFVLEDEKAGICTIKLKVLCSSGHFHDGRIHELVSKMFLKAITVLL